MTRVPASRYVVFALLAGGGLFWDLFTKHVVFTDLGYPADYAMRRIEPVPGRHTLFDAPAHVEGVSVAYLEGWASFRLLTSFNPGALWGIGPRWTWLFGLLSIVAACGIVYWLFVHGAANSLWLTICLSLIMAGTLGNLWDRAGLHGCVVDGKLQHAVRDFLYFTFGNYNYPVFNFADVFLVTGAVMLVLQSFFGEPGSPAGASKSDQTKSDAVGVRAS